MTFSQAVLAFALVAALLTVVPGLDTAIVLRTTLSRSRRHGLAAALGIQAGTLVWGATAATGAAALLAASRTAYRVLEALGAAYMVWLGASMLWRSWRTPRTTGGALPGLPGDSSRVTPGHPGRPLRSFATGLVTNLTNPKVGAFYVATIPQFVPDRVSPLLMGVLLAAVHCAMGTVWLGTLVLGAERLGPRLRSSGAVRWVDRITGGVLVALGARLAASARS